LLDTGCELYVQFLSELMNERFEFRDRFSEIRDLPDKEFIPSLHFLVFLEHILVGAGTKLFEPDLHALQLMLARTLDPTVLVHHYISRYRHTLCILHFILRVCACSSADERHRFLKLIFELLTVAFDQGEFSIDRIQRSLDLALFIHERKHCTL